MTFYTADGSSYEGMDQDTVTRLRTELGRTTTFIDKAAYDVLIQAQQVH